MVGKMYTACLLSVFCTYTYAAEAIIVPSRIEKTDQKRKDPTADLPDLSRDELLAILDLIEKSGEPSGRKAPSIPSPAKATTVAPLYPILPTTSAPSRPNDDSSDGFVPLYPKLVITSTTSRPSINYPEQTTEYPTIRPTPPSYPAPIAPPSPATTPKPKSFFEKFIKSIAKIVSPQSANLQSTSNSGNYLNTFLQQLQNVNQQSGIEQRNKNTPAAGNVLDGLLDRLQGQNGEGSQFVVNLIKTLRSDNPNTQTNQAASGNTNSGTDQLISAILKGITQSVQSPSTQSSNNGGGFLESFQRELLKSAVGPTTQNTRNEQRSTSEVLFDGFKQLLQQQISKN